MTALPSTTRRRGRLHEWRVRWFGEPDAVARQLDDIARQGASMARLAHVCAFALIVLFSAGSLVALGGDALASIVSGWQSGRVDLPAAISVGVSALLVLCMDTGMIYAASMLRLLNSRHAEGKEKRVHQFVMFAVAILEAATYTYMSWRYESPAALAAWALIVARGSAAPLLSVYLSMARPLPVTSRDILYQAELAAGQGVIRDVVEAASDGAAPLAEKMALYGAAATMTAQDRGRLDEMIRAVGLRGVTSSPSTPDRGPTGPGSPIGAPVISEAEKPMAGHVIALPRPSTSRRKTAARARSSMGVRTRGVRTPAASLSYEAQARTAWADGAQSIDRMKAATGMSHSVAQSWVRTLKAEEQARGEGKAQ